MRRLQKTVLQHCSDELAKRLNAPSGLRDEALLDSAFGRAENYLHFHPHADVFDLGAQYAQGIIRNHPFVDSIRRIAYIACCLFLKLNGWEIQASKDEKAALIQNLATSSITPKEFGAWLRAVSVKKRIGSIKINR